MFQRSEGEQDDGAITAWFKQIYLRFLEGGNGADCVIPDFPNTQRKRGV